MAARAQEAKSAFRLATALREVDGCNPCKTLPSLTKFPVK